MAEKTKDKNPSTDPVNLETTPLKEVEKSTDSGDDHQTSTKRQKQD